MRWNAEVYDPILRKRDMTDGAMTEFMQDQHLPVSFDDVKAARRRLSLEPNRRPPVHFMEPPSALPK